jgi:plastocyanin
MRRGAALLAVLSIFAAACSGASGEERVVRVDFKHDEFASHYWRYFPTSVYAQPGDTVVFRQEWTGEPHTVSFGSALDDLSNDLRELEEEFSSQPDTPEAEAAGFQRYKELTEGIVLDPYLDASAPTAAKPCYLTTGSPARYRDATCPQREQPSFDGKHSFYSSGFIAPLGPEGNVFRVPLDDEIEPGTYSFYCVIHFQSMQGSLIVAEPGEDVPSAREQSRSALDQIEKLATPLREAFEDMKAGRAETAGERLSGPIAGYHAGDEFTVAIDEFVPEKISARVNEPISWTVIGAHTISFDVPRFVPVYQVSDDGTVERNPVVDEAAGGSPDPPPPDFQSGPIEIDGGTWDGDGFFSSGLLAGEPTSKYTLRVSKAGEYRFACLVHPDMVGTLEVTG